MTTEAPVQEPPLPPAKPRSKKALIITVAIVGALAIIAAITLVILGVLKDQQDRAESDRRQFFLSARSQCDIAPSDTEVIDDYNTIVFERVTKYDGATGEQIFCFLDDIGAPESLATKIENTRSLDGTRDQTWNGFRAEWTYHPDDGLYLLVERTQ